MFNWAGDPMGFGNRTDRQQASRARPARTGRCARRHRSAAVVDRSSRCPRQQPGDQMTDGLSPAPGCQPQLETQLNRRTSESRARVGLRIERPSLLRHGYSV